MRMKFDRLVFMGIKTFAVGDLLAAERKRIGLTQEQLAERIGVGRASIQNWESGKHQPSASDLIALADVFNKTVDSLLGRDPKVGKISEAIEQIEDLSEALDANQMLTSRIQVLREKGADYRYRYKGA